MKKGLRLAEWSRKGSGWEGVFCAVVFALGFLVSGCGGSPSNDPGGGVYHGSGGPCFPNPRIEEILPQEVGSGDSIRVPLEISGFHEGDKIYLDGPVPAGMAIREGENGPEIFWRACGYYDSPLTVTVVLENQCRWQAKQSFQVSVRPLPESFYLGPMADLNMTIGDSVTVPLSMINDDPELQFILNVGWANVSGRNLHLTPWSALDGNLEILATTDGCSYEMQPIRVQVPPVEYEGLVYDYFRKLKVENAYGEKEDWYYLRRQIGYGLSDQELDNKVSDLESAISANYTLVRDSSVAKWNRPTSIELIESENCPDLGYAAYYKLLGGVGPGIMCITNILNVKRNASHEDIHARLIGRIPNTDVLGGRGQVQESFAYAIAEVVSENFTSFSEIPVNEYYGYVDFINDLHVKYGFDVKDLPAFFDFLDQKTGYGTRVLPLKEYKCALDTFFHDDTSPIYCRSFTCSSDPKYFGIYDIPTAYCGDPP